ATRPDPRPPVKILAQFAKGDRPVDSRTFIKLSDDAVPEANWEDRQAGGQSPDERRQELNPKWMENGARRSDSRLHRCRRLRRGHHCIQPYSAHESGERCTKTPDLPEHGDVSRVVAARSQFEHQVAAADVDKAEQPPHDVGP